MLMSLQISLAGSKRAPVFSSPLELLPPHTIISRPVQTAVGPRRAVGAPILGVELQVFEAGFNRPPVSVKKSGGLTTPPQTIISVPVQTAECNERADGAPSTGVGIQVSVAGL